ncbi:MAG: MMPL family transporter [Pseudomonadales bacterium]|nr:MMPL family transporter [Pseudomonadales bacterium]
MSAKKLSFNDICASWLIRYRYLLALLSLITVTLLASGVSKVYLETDYRLFFKPDNPFLVAHEFIQDNYTPSSNVAFVIADKSGDVFNANTLSAIEELTTLSWQMPYSVRVDSISNYQHTQGIDDDLVVESFIEDALAMTPAQIESKKAIALADKTLVYNILSDSGHATLINIRLAMPTPPKGELSKDHEVIAYARLLKQQIQAKHPQLIIHVFGETAINNAFSEMSAHDGQVLMPIMGLLIILALITFFKLAGSTLLSAALLCFTSIIMIIASLATALGMAGWLDMPLNAVNSIAPTIILTLAVADCVHILTSYINTLPTSASRAEAMEQSLRLNLQPVFLTSLTTAIGFFSLNFSDAPPFHSLGNITGVGIITAFILAITLIPALAILLPIKAGKRTENKTRLLDKLADFVIAKHNHIFWLTLIIVTVCIAFIPQNKLNDSPLTYFDDTVPFHQAASFFQDNITGFDNIVYSLDSGTADGINDPAFLQQVDALKSWILQQDGVSYVGAYTDVLKRLNQNMHANDVAWYQIPQSRELAAQYLLLYEMSLPFGLDTNTQINNDKSALQLNVYIRHRTPDQVIALERQISDHAAGQYPDMHITPGSSISIMFAHLGQRNIEGMFIGNILALLFVTITLIIALRSFKYGLLSIIPNIIPPLAALGIWAMISGQVNLVVALVFVITLGIVVDDTVHFLSKYLRARRQQGLGPEQAIRYAYSTVGNALIITSAVLATGFMVLAQSHFLVNATMGLLVALTIVLALVLDLLFLPALLLKLDTKAKLEVNDKQAIAATSTLVEPENV